MLDTLYENIGGKIKNWAKWIFIIEAIGAIITGLVLLCTDEDLILYGLLTAICGPIVAYVSSWILYAFGELVEDVHVIRYNKKTIDNTKISPEIESTTSIKGHSPTQKAKLYMEMGVAPEKVGTGYICPVCKMTMDSMSPCERCGYIPPQSN